MKPRHAAALALVAWCLSIRDAGKTVPKNCSVCGYTAELEARACVAKFETKDKCKIGANEYVQHYYVKADKRGELVVIPPVATCGEFKPITN